MDKLRSSWFRASVWPWWSCPSPKTRCFMDPFHVHLQLATTMNPAPLLLGIFHPPPFILSSDAANPPLSPLSNNWTPHYHESPHSPRDIKIEASSFRAWVLLPHKFNRLSLSSPFLERTRMTSTFEVQRVQQVTKQENGSAASTNVFQRLPDSKQACVFNNTLHLTLHNLSTFLLFLQPSSPLHCLTSLFDQYQRYR